MQDNALHYKVISPAKVEVADTIQKTDLEKILAPDSLDVLESFHPEKLEPYMPKILVITAERQHTRKRMPLGTRDEIAHKKKGDQLEKDAVIAHYESVIAVTDKYSLGNCTELATQVFDYVLTEAGPDVRVEIFYINGGDHVFAVLNRDPASDPSNPMTWGSNAVICDPWADLVYPAEEYAGKLKDYWFDGKKNQVRDIKHPQKLAASPRYNTGYFREHRNLNNLVANFTEASQKLIKQIQAFNSDLKEEKKRIVSKYNPQDKKAQIIETKNNLLDNLVGELVKAMEVKVNEIKQKIILIDKKDYQKEYRNIKLNLNEELKAFHKKSIGHLSFSQSDTTSLFSKRWPTNKSISDTQKNIEEAVNRANKAYFRRHR